MTPVCLSLLAASLTLAPMPQADGKTVRRVWFPRFSPDGTLLLSANGGWEKNQGGEARLFAAKGGGLQHVFPHPRGVRSVAWAMKGTMIVTSGYSQGVRGFDVKGRKELFHLGGDQSVENVRVTSDDKLLIASFGSGDIRLYDLATRKEEFLFGAAHDNGIWGLAVSPTDALLASGGKDGYANVYDLAARKKLHSLKHPTEVNGLAFSPDGKLLATGCGDSRIRLFDTKTGDRVGMFKAHDRGTVTDLQFTSDGKLLASAGGDGNVCVWDVTDRNSPTAKKTIRAHTGMAFGVAVSPDDKLIASAGWDDQLKVWDLQTGELVWGWKRD